MMNEKKSIAIDVGGTRIKIAVVNCGKVEKFTTIPANSEGTFESRLPDIERVVKELAGDLSSYSGLGISLPCLVDSKNKRATEIYSKFEDLPNLNLCKWAQETFGLPLVIGQDSKVALLGESHFGCAKGYDDAVMVIMGTGVGTAVMIDGKLLEGKRFSAGALGSHIVIEMKNGRKCTCKSSGCLEAYTSSWALPKIVKEQPDYNQSLLSKVDKIDFKALHDCVTAGDKVAKDVLDYIVCAMRAGIISFIHAYSPEIIVFSGGPMNMGEVFTKPLFEGINDVIWGKNDVEFKVAENPDLSVLLGLHYMVTQL